MSRSSSTRRSPPPAPTTSVPGTSSSCATRRRAGGSRACTSGRWMLDKAPLVVAVLGRARAIPGGSRTAPPPPRTSSSRPPRSDWAPSGAGCARTPTTWPGTSAPAARCWRAARRVAHAGAHRRRPPRREEEAAHAAPGEQGQLRALRQALALTERSTVHGSRHDARGPHPGHRPADLRGHPRGQAVAALARALAGRDDGMGHGRRASQGGDAALRRRLPHAAQPPRDEPPPARVLRPRRASRRPVLRWGISLTGRPLAGGSAGERRDQAADEGLRAALHRGPGRAQRHPGPQGAARPRHGLHPRRARRGHGQRSRGATPTSRRTSSCSTGSPPRPRRWPAVAVVDDSAWGPLPRVNLSLKITSLYSQIDPVDFDRQRRRRQGPPAPHLPQGHRDRAPRSPSTSSSSATATSPSACSPRCSTRRSSAATTTPASCCRPTCATPTATSTSCSPGRASADRAFNLRLVKGAYWDYETVIAAQEGWPVPVFTHKPDTDAMYEKLAAGDAAASRRTCARPSPATTCARWRSVDRDRRASSGWPTNAFEIQMLHGMGEPDQAGGPRHGPASARVRAGRRAHPRHGLPGAAAAREHGQRLLPAADVRRRGPPWTSSSRPPETVRRLRRRARRLPRVVADRPATPGAVRQPAARRLLAPREPRSVRRGARRGARPPRGALPAAHRRPRHRDGADADVGEPGGAGRGGRHGRLRRPCRGRSRRGRGRARRAAGVARRHAAGARRRALPRRRAHARRVDGARRRS